MSLLDPIKPYWYIIRTVLFGIVVLVAVLYVRGCGKAAGEAEVAALKAKHATTLSEIAQQTAKASEKARAAEKAVAVSFAKIHDQHAQDLTDAQARADATVAGIRTDLIRLRNHWTCPEVPSAPGVAGDPGQGQDAADLRAQDIGRVRGYGAQCDADLKSWQARWEAWKVEYDQYRKGLQ